MAGGFRQADIARDHGAEYFTGEVTADFLGHLGGEVGSAVKHGQGHAEDLQPWVQTLFDHPQRVHQVAEAFQGVVFALYGN